MKIKICGITRLEDAKIAVEAGAWAIGYIFYEKSKRYINSILAGEISAEISAEKIGVFVNSSIDEILDIAKKSAITKIQLHGDEDIEFVKKLNEQTALPVIKAIRVNAKQDILKAKEFEPVVDMLLFDTYSKNEYGGTGECFDWELLSEEDFIVPVILSGGIGVHNIKTALNAKVYALDISSGVEISKGVKDKDKINQIFGLAN